MEDVRPGARRRARFARRARHLVALVAASHFALVNVARADVGAEMNSFFNDAGGAANVALNIAALGARCTVGGFVGSDESGAKLTQSLESKKIAVIKTPGSAQTIVKTRVMVQRQQLCRIDL